MLIDPLKPCPEFENEKENTPWVAKGKRYVVSRTLEIDLHKELPEYQGGSRRFHIIGRTLFVDPGCSWDGATWAIDHKSLLASLVHDCLCWAADDGHRHSGVWRQNLFVSICRAQGMCRAVCLVRWTVLQTFGRIYQAL